MLRVVICPVWPDWANLKSYVVKMGIIFKSVQELLKLFSKSPKNLMLAPISVVLTIVDEIFINQLNN